MRSPPFRLNSLREKRIGDRVLLVSYTGSWIVLDDLLYDKFRSGDMDPDLFEKLEKEGLILTDSNRSSVIDSYKARKPQLFQGTSLHIIVVTLRCNERCIYCHASSRDEKSGGLDMDIATARKAVDFIFQSPSGTLSIEFQGGEPLLNFPAVKEIIEYANKKNRTARKVLYFSLVTNMSLMDEEILDFLIKSNVGICTSLDGPKEIHEKNRILAGSSSHEHVINWTREIRKRDHDITALLTVTRNSLGHHKEIIDEYRRLGFRKVWLRNLNNLGKASKIWDRIAYTPQEFLGFWREGVDYAFEKKDIIESSSLILLKKMLLKDDPFYLDLMSPCGAAIGQMAYYFNGDIYTCDEARMLQEERFRLGNVASDTYAGIFLKQKTRKVISASINESQPCITCPYQPYCGLCPVCTYSITGSLAPNPDKDSRCQIIEGQFDHLFNRISGDSEFRKRAEEIVRMR